MNDYLSFPELVQHFGPSAGVIVVLGYAVRQLMKWLDASMNKADAQQKEIINSFKSSIVDLRSAYEKKQELMDARLVERQEQIRILEVQNQRDRADYQSRSLAIEKEHSAVMNTISKNMERLAIKIDNIGCQVEKCDHSNNPRGTT